MQYRVNPFDVETAEGKQLFYVASGSPANLDDEHELFNYITNGVEAAAHFIQARLVDKSEQFHAPMKKLKLETCANVAVEKKIPTSKQ